MQSLPPPTRPPVASLIPLSFQSPLTLAHRVVSARPAGLGESGPPIPPGPPPLVRRPPIATRSKCLCVSVVICHPHPFVRLGLRVGWQDCPTVRVIADCDNVATAVESACLQSSTVILLHCDPSAGEFAEDGPLSWIANFNAAHDRTRFVALINQPTDAAGHDLPTFLDGCIALTDGVVAMTDRLQWIAAGRRIMPPGVRNPITTPAPPPPPPPAPRLSDSSTHSTTHPSAAPHRPAAGALSSRESEVLTMLSEGMTNRQAAEQLELSVKTVETYRARLCRKLNLRDRADIIAYVRGRA